jgi:2-polyprenyl-3-methyl-5-hydroxy-6-metoxy-1,4-benzoquinol methylase
MSTGGEASRYARFNFRPHFHQHAGFRLARSTAPPRLSHVDSPPPHVGAWNPCSLKTPGAASGNALGRALLTHYAAEPLTTPLAGVLLDLPALNFPARATALLSAAVHEHCVRTAAVLDLGCSVGGLSFALAEVFHAVLAIDLSAECIATALDMQANGVTTARCDDTFARCSMSDACFSAACVAP